MFPHFFGITNSYFLPSFTKVIEKTASAFFPAHSRSLVTFIFPFQNYHWANTQFLLFSEEYFVGASLPAWAAAGSLAYYSRGDRKYWSIIVIMISLPLGYKILITKLDRFISDIAHLSAWFFGLGLTGILSTFRDEELYRNEEL